MTTKLTKPNCVRYFACLQDINIVESFGDAVRDNLCEDCQKYKPRIYVKEEKTSLDKVKVALAKLGSIPPIHINCSYEYTRDETKVHELEQLSGKSVEELIELFAAGWELRPPTYVSDLLSMMGSEEVR